MWIKKMSLNKLILLLINEEDYKTYATSYRIWLTCVHITFNLPLALKPIAMISNTCLL